MPYRFREARIRAGKTVTQVAKDLGVSQGTVSNWDMERKLPSIETLVTLADYYGVTTDYLLGRSHISEQLQKLTVPVPAQNLPALHGIPCWHPNNGWGIIDSIDSKIYFLENEFLTIDQTSSLSILPPPFALEAYPLQFPLPLRSVCKHDIVWVEPISSDHQLRIELKGWYSVKERYVENETGARFYFDKYQVKWIAYQEENDD